MRCLVGGATAENHDLEEALAAKTPLVIGVVLALGFLLLLVALQAPILAAVKLMVGDLWRNRDTVAIGQVSQIPMSTTVEALLSPFRVWAV